VASSFPSAMLMGEAHRGRPGTAAAALSYDEFRSEMRSSLKERGVVESLKSQLRASLVSELQAKSLGGARVKNKSLSPAAHPATLLVTRVDCSAQGPQKKQRSLGEQAVHALVADFLRASSMPYTLSVFGPESGGERSISLFVLPATVPPV
jgi:hypothetical protein